MIVIGLTGSIGMGKSTVAAMFRAIGVPVFDADAEVRRLQASGSPLLAHIEARFPGTTSEYGVDRQKLGAAVFGKPTELRALEAIMHPAVKAIRQQFLAHNRSRPAVVLDIPLLLESGRRDDIDLILVVSAPLWKQRRRVLARPVVSLAKFKSINAHQMPDRQKRAMADIVIETGGAITATRAAIHEFVACIRAKHGQYGFNARNHFRHRNNRSLTRKRGPNS